MTQSSSSYGASARGLMALSTISPALILLGIKGIGDGVVCFSETQFRCFCIGLGVFFGFVLPWGIISLWYPKAVQKTLENVSVTEGGDHMIVYAVAVILPLWAGETGSHAELTATTCAFVMVWFLIASSNLHHANLYLRLRGYRFFNASPIGESTRAFNDSFLILSQIDISGRPKTLFCRVLDGKLLVMKES